MHLAVSLNIAAADGQDVLDFGQISTFARQAEAAGVDMVIISDSLTSGEPSTSPFEATTLLAALATVTKKIGLVASASTLAHQPYNLARRFASLDIISHGRVGWNATLRQSPLEAANFSRPAGIPNDDFRRRAEEFIGIVQGLWRGWDADALLFDKAGGRFHDPAKTHVLDHKGEFFAVRGPLNVARSPQDMPVLAMSGLAGADLDFAAGVADVIAIEEPSPEGARATCDDLKKRVLTAGRTPDALKVLTTVFAPDLTAARLEAWLGTESCDGLIFALPADLSAINGFTDRIVPELRRRNSDRSAYYADTTLRAHLGLGDGGAQ
ncbi:Nitrilotriacetate monooxygenase component A [Mesorhizobium plurifarium]|uniref:Nitrilotriacetate monooxygenase component A n=1 Tax=Mesorhizobium plurifarium TaxID=69974 RepID=A0A090DAG3_MESPL|nr:Nitrilotriacetate monooxygenase component A [Mesorhizobium plurifarium]